MTDKKPLTSIAIIGHVDHGKSTLMGHFLFDIGAVDPRVMKKHEADANGLGMSSWKWAYVLDAFQEEMYAVLGLYIFLTIFAAVSTILMYLKWRKRKVPPPLYITIAYLLLTINFFVFSLPKSVKKI